MDDYNWNYSNAVGLNATWAIFDGGRARAQYRQNKQRAEESKFNFASERDRIRSEVEDSFFTFVERPKISTPLPVRFSQRLSRCAWLACAFKLV